MSSSAMSDSHVLNSWKEIANHVGRGVRTVQRWERDLGMPVRRPRAKSRSAVIAMADEIDAWLRNAPTVQVSFTHLAPSDTSIQLRQSIDDHLQLRHSCMQLRAANQQALSALLANLQFMHDAVTKARDLETQDRARR